MDERDEHEERASQAHNERVVADEQQVITGITLANT